jgi:hypothetical protein
MLCILFCLVCQMLTHYFSCLAGTRYAELAFLHLLGVAVHVMHFCASGARNADVLFFILGWARSGCWRS